MMMNPRQAGGQWLNSREGQGSRREVEIGDRRRNALGNVERGVFSVGLAHGLVISSQKEKLSY